MSSERGRDGAGTMAAEFFETLVEESPDAVVSVNPDGRIVYANDSTERLFGYAPDAIVGESIAVLLPQRHRDAFRERAEQYLETGEQTVNRNALELVGQRADGEEIAVSVTIVEHESGTERVFSAVIRDIEDRLQREDTLLAEQTTDVEASGNEPIERPLVAASDIAMEAWTGASVSGAKLHIEGDPGSVRADAERVRTLLRALFDWLTEDASEIHLGGLDDGFYLAADERVEDPVPTSVERAEADLNWNVSVDTRDGGVRIEVTGVER